MSSNRAAEPRLRDKIAAKAREEDEADHYHRARYSPTFLSCAQVIEWLSSKSLEFTSEELREELECHSETALRWLRTLVLLDWVEVISEGRRGKTAVYRSRVRIRRVG